MSTASSQNGGWLSGTLDVIAGRVTPTGTPSRRGHVRSASTGAAIQRLPSQDSLDRSIHNDSGHGKSTAQIIRDLRTSNARLTAQTAQMEASFMNQMAVTSAKLEDQMDQLKLQLGQKDKSIQSLENRCTQQDARLNEKEEQIGKLKEDSAFQRHTISELRSQVNEESAPEAEFERLRTKNAQLTKDLDELSRNFDGQDSAQGSVWKQLERSQKSLQRSEEALIGFQGEQKILVMEYEKKFISLKKKIAEGGGSMSELQAEVNARDEAISELKANEVQHAKEMEDMKEHILKLEKEHQTREHYRRDEADDLRVLNDAQEEENVSLKKQLDQALRQVEMRDQELEEARLSTKDEDSDLAELQKTVGELSQELESANNKSATEVSQEVQNLRAELGRSQNDKEELVTLHEKELARLQQMVTKAKTEFSRELQEKQKELETVSRKLRTGAPSADVAKLQAQLKEYQLQSETRVRSRQSSGEAEENLRKELEKAQETEQHLADQLGRVVTETDQEIKELQEKLSDRDTTISSLVKASVALEQQVAAANIKIKELEVDLSGSQDKGVDVILAKGLTSAHDVDDLRATVAGYKESEERLSKEVFRLKRQIRQAKEENVCLQSLVESRNNEDYSMDASSNGISATGSTTKQLKERDEAIAKLVQQSMAQERVVSELRERLLTVSGEIERSRSAEDAPTWDEVQQLRQETEMFAGQVIEQDEEIESLRLSVEQKNAEIVALQAELSNSRQRPTTKDDNSQHTRSLEAELDELREARDEQMQELRVLRRTAREFELSADRIAQARSETREAQESAEEYKRMVDSFAREKAGLFQELEQERTHRTKADQRLLESKEAAEELAELYSVLKTQNVSVDDLKEGSLGLSRSGANISSTVDEMEVAGLKSDKENLERSLSNQSSALDQARETIRELEHMLAEKTSSESATFEHEKDELMHEIESLTEQLDQAREELQALEGERCLIDEFKSKLELADEAREESEKTIIDTYERKVSLLTLDKDVTIDKLRKELVETKEITEEEVRQAHNELQVCQGQIIELKEEMSAQLEQRETKIFALEQTLEAQEQLVTNMKTEMDHLQGSMVNTTVGRREELEEMQQELTDMTTSNAKQEREIKSLKMQLEEQQLAHSTEVKKLQGTVSSLETTANDSTHHRTAADLQMELRVKEVKERLEKLKFRNQTLQEENENLRQYLENAQKKLRGEVGDEEARLREELNAEQSRVANLKAELDKKARTYAKRVKELEAELRPELQATTVKEPVTPDRKKTPRRIGFLGKKKKKAEE